MFVRNEFNYDMARASIDSGLDCQHALDSVTGELIETPSKTKQAFRDECDVNVIAKRFNLLGELPQGVRAPTYADFEEVVSFHDAMTAIRQAQESFMMMPPDVRARFHNDPGEFVEFCSEDANRPEAVKLGLLLPEVADLVPASQGPSGPSVVTEAASTAPPKGAA